MSASASFPPSETHPESAPEGPSLAHTALEAISEGVFSINLDKRITTFNHAAEAITGFARQEAIGQFCFDILRANICATSCPLDQWAKAGSTHRSVPAFIINQAGDQIPVSVSSSLLRNERGERIGFIEIIRDLSELEELRRQVARAFSPEDIIGKHPRMQEIFAVLPDIAVSDSAVLIEGPTGSGKELFARAIHHLNPRRKGPFIAISCGALPDTLLESELFGYKRGAFTGAGRDKPGRFSLADGGSLFLDEICNTSTAFQADLLRVLEEREFTPLGDTKSVKTDFRVIAATNRDLKAMIREGTFREDLYYRLNVAKINLPPLSERKEDIPLLVDHFIHRFNLLKGRSIKGTKEEVLPFFMSYPFPGNIRELENLIEYAYILCKEDLIGIEHLPRDFMEWFESIPENFRAAGTLALEEAKRIRMALEKHGGNRILTARELGIGRSTLWRKMKKYNIV